MYCTESKEKNPAAWKKKAMEGGGKGHGRDGLLLIIISARNRECMHEVKMYSNFRVCLGLFS